MRAQSRGEGGACRTQGSCEGVAATGPSSGHRQGPGQRDALQHTGSHSDFHDPGAATAQELVSSHRDGHSKSPGQRESREVSSGPQLNEKGGSPEALGTHCTTPGTDGLRQAQPSSRAQPSSGWLGTAPPPRHMQKRSPDPRAHHQHSTPGSPRPGERGSGQGGGRGWGDKEDVPARICVARAPHTPQPRKRGGSEGHTLGTRGAMSHPLRGRAGPEAPLERGMGQWGAAESAPGQGRPGQAGGRQTHQRGRRSATGTQGLSRGHRP